MNKKSKIKYYAALEQIKLKKVNRPTPRDKHSFSNFIKYLVVLLVFWFFVILLSIPAAIALDFFTPLIFIFFILLAITLIGERYKLKIRK